MVRIIKEAISGGHLPLCFLNWKIMAAQLPLIFLGKLDAHR
jgi:hypothetical protein